MKISPNIKIFKNKDGLKFIDINNDKADARIALQGAHVDWWKPKLIKDDVLWLSSNARYEKGRSIRGGVPICWPWFGEHPTDNSFCLHGFARVIPWELIESSDLKNGSTKIVLKMIPTKTVRKQLTYNFDLTLSIVVGETLSLNLKTTNLSDSPFTISEGFHTYFYVSDIENVKVSPTTILKISSKLYVSCLLTVSVGIIFKIIFVAPFFKSLDSINSQGITLANPCKQKLLSVGCSPNQGQQIGTPPLIDLPFS